MTSLMKNPLVVGSGAIALVGIGVYVYQLMFGLGITGMNNSTSWGLYLTCFMFFVGLSAGGLSWLPRLPSSALRSTRP